MAIDVPSLTGRNAVVVGSAGLGAAIAVRLTRAGARTAAAIWGEGSGDEVHLDRRILIDSPDRPAAVAEAVQAAGNIVGPPDILVVDLLPAVVPAPLDETDPAAIGQALARVTCTAAAMRAAFDGLKAQGRGRIILVGHRYGTAVAEGIVSYNSAAWALTGLLRSAAVDWGRHGIATNMLLPVAATAEYRRAREINPGVLDRMVSQLPLGRMGDPIEDIGGAAVFLAGDAASFINGQIVPADGGQHIAGPVLNPAKFATA